MIKKTHKQNHPKVSDQHHHKKLPDYHHKKKLPDYHNIKADMKTPYHGHKGKTKIKV